MSALVLPAHLATEFHCALCGTRHAVDFKDPAAFDEPEPLPNRGKWAAEQALIEANKRLEKHARAALKLVVCPACKKRDDREVRRALYRGALPLLGVAPGFFMFGVIATSLLFPVLSRGRVFVPVLVGAIIVVLATPLIALRRRQKLLDEADTAISFLPGPGEQRDQA
jgi:hypothetical protein